MGKAESPIQAYALQRLQALENQGKCYFFRNNSFSGKLTRYNGSQGYVNNGKPGMPDIVACFYKEIQQDIQVYWGQFVGFECKSLTGKQSAEQKRAQEMIERVGGNYYIIRTPEEFESALKELL